MDNYKTIKELAEELGISKQGLQKRINGLPDNLKPTKVGGKYLIDIQLQQYFKTIFLINGNKTNNQVADIDNQLSDVVDILKKENSMLIKRIENKEIEFVSLQKLLDQQQQLTLQANKQIEQLQTQLFLTVGEEGTEESVDAVQEKIQDEVTLGNDQEKSSTKKWFQFWK